MNVVFLQGGLGNQMFQYAFYLSKKKKCFNLKYDCSLLLIGKQHNGFELDKLFGIKYQSSKYSILKLKLFLFIKKIEIPCLQPIYNFLSSRLNIIEDSMPSLYCKQLMESSGSFYGYWQSEHYFSNIDSEIRRAYTFSISSLSIQTIKCKSIIEETLSISIHVRRGDYMYAKNIELYGGICTTDYYNNSIKYMITHVSNPFFFVFSDDIEWTKKNLIIPNATYVDWNKDIDSWQDMFLMSKCKHNIIANSSFSWWGAWLNENREKIVVTPSRFLNRGNSKDVICDGWVKL